MQDHPLFDLTKAGRRTLEAVCGEFERCSRYYPPLYHQRMKTWKEDEGETSITMQQWENFKQAEGDWNQAGD